MGGIKWLRTFIQFSSLVLTLEAAIFLVKSNLRLSAEAIAEISSTKSCYNRHLVACLVQQGADTRFGVLFLLGAFILQMGNALWPMRFVDFGVHRGGVAFALVLWFIFGVGAYFFAKKVAHNTALDVKKILEPPEAPPEPTPAKTE